jgi:hypothetical protein
MDQMISKCLIFILSASALCSTAKAFINNHGQQEKALITFTSSPLQLYDKHQEQDNTERRKFLITSLGIFSSTLPTIASAASDSSSSSASMNYLGPSKKVGGLANKIRNICKNMVC